MSSLSEYIQEIEKEEPESPEINFKELFNGEVPPLPKYKKHNSIKNPNDYYAGKIKENKEYSGEGMWIVSFRCKTCGCLQWVGGWHEINCDSRF